MDLQELMRIGSLTMNFLQSDHFKQLMGMMGGMGFGQSSEDPNNKSPGQNTNSLPMQPNSMMGMDQLLSNPLSSLFGGNKKGQQTKSFPFTNQGLPPWMQQRVNANPYLNHPMFNGQPNKRPSPLGNLFNLFSPGQKQIPQNMQQWTQPFMGMGNPIPPNPRGTQTASMSQASRVQPATMLRSEKNRIHIKDDTRKAQRSRRKNKSR